MFLITYGCVWLDEFYLNAHSDSSQQSFRYISHNNTNEEDDSLQPAVAQDDGQDEKGDSQEDSHACDDVDEVLDLLGNGGLPGFQPWGQTGNAAHHCTITSAYDNSAGSAWEKHTKTLLHN